MLDLPNDIPRESRRKICVFKTDGSRWAMRPRRLPNPSSPRRRGRPPPKVAAEHGLTEMRHVTEIKGNAERPQTRRRARVEQR